MKAGKAHCESGRREESVRFPGLRTFLTRVLDDVALGMTHGRFNLSAALRVVRNTAERLNYLITREKVEPEQLRPEARQLLGWFRYFSAGTAFEHYAGAVQRAQRVLPASLSTQPKWPAPFLIHYRPSALLYRIHASGEGTRVILDTPMMTFDDGVLRQLGQRILGRERNQRAMMAAMTGAEYQRMIVELDAAGGVVVQTHGRTHDLAESFERVNRRYFDGQMPRPSLAWNRTPTGRKFGHYDFIHDRVCISRSLDTPEVPVFVVDQVMHHELLHKKHGFRFRGERQHAHTPEFRREERRFQEYREADDFLKKLCRQK